MRLIDADANKATMLKCAENPESMKAELCYRFTARILEEAPSIDAVPISSLRKILLDYCRIEKHEVF